MGDPLISSTFKMTFKPPWCGIGFLLLLSLWTRFIIPYIKPLTLAKYTLLNTNTYVIPILFYSLPFYWSFQGPFSCHMWLCLRWSVFHSSSSNSPLVSSPVSVPFQFGMSRLFLRVSKIISFYNFSLFYQFISLYPLHRTPGVVLDDFWSISYFN